VKSLPQLVELHRHRLTLAEKTLREARRQLIDKQTEQDRRRTQLFAHRAKAKRCEQTLYAQVVDHVVKRHAVEMIKEALVALRIRELQLEEELECANQLVLDMEEQVQVARLAYEQQLVRMEKFLELQRHFNTIAQRMRQVKEELDIEELPQRRLPGQS
jgi:hypothetical protein